MQRSSTTSFRAARYRGVAMDAANAQERNRQAYVPGEHVTWNSFNCTCLVDEDFSNYEYVQNWLVSFVDEGDWRELVKDLSLHVLSANKKTLLKFVFVHAFPTSLGDITFDSSVMDSTQMTFTIDFTYQYFNIVRTTV
jgi:hypothetical protein